MTDSAPHLLLDRVSRRFGARFAIKNLSIEFEPGERVALIGPSGSGKSTLLDLLACAQFPTSGRLTVDSVSVQQFSNKQLRRYRRRIAIVPQQLGLVEQLDVQRNIRAGLAGLVPWYQTLAHFVWPQRCEAVDKQLIELNLAGRNWDLVMALSGGERQRVAVARALIRPSVLAFADEPTAALDPVTAKTVARSVQAWCVRQQATLVVSTHWISLWGNIVDRVIGLRDGELMLDCHPSKLSDAQLSSLYQGSDERH